MVRDRGLDALSLRQLHYSWSQVLDQLPGVVQFPIPNERSVIRANSPPLAHKWIDEAKVDDTVPHPFSRHRLSRYKMHVRVIALVHHPLSRRPYPIAKPLAPDT